MLKMAIELVLKTILVSEIDSNWYFWIFERNSKFVVDIFTKLNIVGVVIL